MLLKHPLYRKFWCLNIESSVSLYPISTWNNLILHIASTMHVSEKAIKNRKQTDRRRLTVTVFLVWFSSWPMFTKICKCSANNFKLQQLFNSTIKYENIALMGTCYVEISNTVTKHGFILHWTHYLLLPFNI